MKSLHIPLEISEQIKKGAVVVISISGGKDSQALLRAVVAYMRSNGYTNRLIAIHADLGRVEWENSMSFCESLCNDLAIEFVVVRREKGDLLQRWQDRMHTLKGQNKPHWSSAASRYCTSDMKVQPIDKFLRQFDNVISVQGIRAQESAARAQKPCVCERTAITTRTRTATTWNAIIDWSIEDVWATYGNTVEDLMFAQSYFRYTGKIHPCWQFHPAYAMGNERLSCMMCVLGSKNDIKNGIKNNWHLAQELIDMERESGFAFKQNQSIEQLRNEVIAEMTQDKSCFVSDHLVIKPFKPIKPKRAKKQLELDLAA